MKIPQSKHAALHQFLLPESFCLPDSGEMPAFIILLKFREDPMNECGDRAEIKE